MPGRRRPAECLHCSHASPGSGRALSCPLGPGGLSAVPGMWLLQARARDRGPACWGLCLQRPAALRPVRGLRRLGSSQVLVLWGRRCWSGVVCGFPLGARGGRWAPLQRQGPAEVPPREQLVPTRLHCVLAVPCLGDPAARHVLPLVTSSCSLAVAFLEGHFSPFIPASSPVVPTVLSRVLAKGGTSAASVGHRPRAACEAG